MPLGARRSFRFGAVVALTLVPMVYDEFGELSPVRPTQAKAPEAPFVKVPRVDQAEKVD